MQSEMVLLYKLMKAVPQASFARRRSSRAKLKNLLYPIQFLW